MQEDLKLTIRAKDEASQTIKKVEKELGNVSNSMKKAGDASQSMTVSIVKGAAAYELLRNSARVAIGFMTDAFKESIEGARIMAQVATNVKNAGFAYDELGPKIKAYSENAIKMGFDDESAAESLSKLLVVTKDFGQAQALTNLAMDLARAKNVDLATATKQVTLATQGNVKELKLLGINLDESATTAQNLKSMQDQLKDSAINYSKTTAGQLATVREEWNNVKQEMGDKLMPIAIELFKEFEKNLPEIESLVGTVGGGINTLGKVVGDNLPEIKALAAAWVAYKIAVTSAAGITAISASLTTLTGLLGVTGLSVSGLTGKLITLKATSVGALGIVGAVAAGAGVLIKNSADKLSDVNEEVINTASVATNKAQELANAYNKTHKTALTAMDFGGIKATTKTNWLGIPHEEIEQGTIDITKYREAIKLVKEEIKKVDTKNNNPFEDLTDNSSNVASSLESLKEKVAEAQKGFKTFGDTAGDELITLADTHKEASTKIVADITNVKKQLKDLASTYSSDLASAMKTFNDASKSNSNDLVSSIVANETAIENLKAKLTGGGLTQSDQAAIQEELDGRLKAEEKNAGLISTYSTEIANLKAYNAMSELDQAVSDFEQKKSLAQQEYDDTVSKITSVYKEKKKALTQELNDLKSKQQEEETLYDEKVAFIKAKQAEALTTNQAYSAANLKVTKDQVITEINYYEQLAKAIKAARSASTGEFAVIKTKVSSIATPSHEHGGTVIGARGTEVPIIAHGGETIIPAGQSRNSGNTIVVTLNYPQIKSKDDIEVVRAQIEKALRDVIRVNKVQF